MKQFLNSLKGDKVIWAFVALLALFSFMPVFSASSNLAYKNHGSGNTFTYLLKHAAQVLVGFFILYKDIKTKRREIYLYFDKFVTHIVTKMKKIIAIVMGGYSSEVNISLKSGNVAFKHLDTEKYLSFRVHILKEKWVALDDENNEYPIDKNDFSFLLDGKLIKFDVVFNAIHGNPGENGVLLAYFDLLGIKYTSAPFYQMALTFNKRDTLSVLKQYGIKTAKSVFLNKGDIINVDEIIAKVGLPCFVKPNNAGSSYGISKVYEKSVMLVALEKAYKEDTEILIESFLDGTEVSVGVIQYRNALKVLPITEIVSENDFFDYEAKYEGKSKEITPARISSTVQERVEEVAKKVYKVLNMRGFSRSEYILVNEEPFFLEMNTVPGMTEESILPQQAAVAGISLKELCDNAIQMALN